MLWEVRFLQVFGISDIGLKRESNQDILYYYTNDFGECFAFVCDGMGGQNGGDVASRIVFDVFSENIPLEFVRELEADEIKNLVFKLYEKANEKIYEKSCEIEELKGMGTTCTAVYAKKKEFLFLVLEIAGYILKKAVI